MAGFVIVRTAGDLAKALADGLTPAVENLSAICVRPGLNVPELTFPHGSDQQKWNVLEAALSLVDAEGGDRAEAMRKLIARVAVQRGMTRRAVINSPLADFVAALKQKARPAAKPERPKRRRRKTGKAQKELTPKQAEAVQAYADLNGNIPKAARRCGISPKAMSNRLDGAWKKIGKRPMMNAVKAKTKRLPTDKRGQEIVLSDE